MWHSDGIGGRRAARGWEQLEPRMMLAAQPIISEFMASNNGTIEDGFGQDSDWIELTNIGDAPVNLQGYFLSDSVNNLTKWSFPASTILSPGQYLVVFASDANTVDPLGYYHTNYKLSAAGEHVVLAAPDHTILSEFNTGGASYPPQVTDISYGVSGATVVTGDSPASYLIPTNGGLGTSWTNISFNAAAAGFTSGKAAVGYDTTSTPINYANYFKTAIPSGTTSVYVRTEFDLASAQDVTGLDLNLKYDDGVVVYLNGTKVLTSLAPASPVWNSPPTGSRDDATVIVGNSFDLSPYVGLLQTGKNVLAIQVLNASGSSGLLIDPVLITAGVLGDVGYLATPTPGGPNGGLTQIGPVIDLVEFTPTLAVVGQPIIVSAHIAAFGAPVNPASAMLAYRVMFGAEVSVAMVDNGTGGDAVAGDGTFTAQIPANAIAVGQMVRWAVTGADTNGVTSRSPRYLDPLDSAQYYGTVVVDPSVTTNLPVIQWFIENPNAALNDVGTRSSLYIDGTFYDNVHVDLHGQSTTQGEFTKKSYNFDANSGEKFQFPGTLGSVSDFNLLTNQADKTYFRNTLAYDLYTESGGPGLLAVPTVVQRNGFYYGLYDLVEEAQSEYLERVGLDPDGALYKMGNAFESTTFEVEKKTRKYEGTSDLQALVNSASLNSNQGQIWVTDNLDIAEWVNYFAVQSLIANRDYGGKNYYLYRDTNGTQQWSLLPWDMDLSFGHQWNPSENYFDDDLIFNDGLYVNMGGNHLINRLIAMPLFTQMYVRRLKTLNDEFFGPPGQNISSSEMVAKINALMAQIGGDALIDRNKWGAPGGLSFETPTQAVARVEADFITKRKNFLNSFASIPASQAALPNVTFGTVDYNPAGGNQAQEYFAVVNNSNVAVDISGWTVSGAVNHTFKGGTVIPANGTYYVAADVVKFKLRTTGPTGGQKLWLQGNYEGSLNDVFGQLTLKTGSNATVATTTYGTQPTPGDYDGNTLVDGGDILAWQRSLGSPAVPAGSGADGDGSGTVDAGDLTPWTTNFGTPLVVAASSSSSAALQSQQVTAVIDQLTALPGASSQSIASPSLRRVATHDLAAIVIFADDDGDAWPTSTTASAQRDQLVADVADFLSDFYGLDSTGQLENALDLAFASLAD